MNVPSKDCFPAGCQWKPGAGSQPYRGPLRTRRTFSSGIFILCWPGRHILPYNQPQQQHLQGFPGGQVQTMNLTVSHKQC